MFNLTAAEISAYGAIIVALLVPVGQFVLARFKTSDSKLEKEFNDGIEIRKELRKEVERLNLALDNQDTYYRGELQKKDDTITKLRDELYIVGVKLSATEAQYKDCLARVEEFKNKVVHQGEKVIEQIKNNAITNL